MDDTWTVTLEVFAFDSKEAAAEYAEALTDAFTAMPASADLASSCHWRQGDPSMGLPAIAEARRVKPLVWVGHPVGIMASTGQGASYIVDNRQFRPRFIKWPSGNFAPDVRSLVEAKTAAQSDHEARILSALADPSTGGE